MSMLNQTNCSTLRRVHMWNCKDRSGLFCVFVTYRTEDFSRADHCEPYRRLSSVDQCKFVYTMKMVLRISMFWHVFASVWLACVYVAL